MADKVTKEVQVKVSAPGTAEAGRQLSGLGQTLKDLNNAAKGSGLGGEGSVFTLLKGGGVAVGLKFMADAVRTGADAWREYAAGTLAAHEAILKAASGIPIIGSFIEAGNSLGQVYLDWVGRRNQEKYGPGEGPKFGPYIGEDVRAKEMAESGAALRTAQGLRDPSVAAPVLQQLAATEKQIWELRGKAAVAATDAAKINFQLAADTMEEVLKKSRGDIKTALLNFADNFREGMIPVRKAIFEEGKKAIEAEQQARYDEAQKAAAEMWDNFIAERNARPPSEMPISRYAPAVEGRFLTGAAGGGGNTPEAQTAKNTEKGVQLSTESLTALRNIERLLNQGQGSVTYVR